MNQAERLRAEERMLQMQLLASMNTQEAYDKVAANLTEQVGQIYVWENTIPAELRVDPETGLDPDFDVNALRALKARIAAGR